MNTTFGKCLFSIRACNQGHVGSGPASRDVNNSIMTEDTSHPPAAEYTRLANVLLLQIRFAGTCKSAAGKASDGRLGQTRHLTADEQRRAWHAPKPTSFSAAASSHHGTRNKCPVSALAPAAVARYGVDITNARKGLTIAVERCQHILPTCACYDLLCNQRCRIL